jgi:hypothetical protein
MSFADLTSHPDPRTSSQAHPESSSLGFLFLASFATLYFEILVIRYISTEIRIFAYLKNMPLIASFLGIGRRIHVHGTAINLVRDESHSLAFSGLWWLVFVGAIDHRIPVDIFELTSVGNSNCCSRCIDRLASFLFGNCIFAKPEQRS